MALSRIYRHSLALLTDLYQLTMAYGYHRAGIADKEAVFHLFFRENPFEGGFAVAAGLAQAVELIDGFGFDDEDLAYLASLNGNDERPLFDDAFLERLRSTPFACSVDAVPEGTIVFAHEPLLRIEGPILQCQLLETALLNIINFQTLIASKAARVALAARGEPVLEFGLRRAQGIDGGLMASRAAWIGGCAATSNVLAGKLYGIPVRGTHAHSWVMAFEDELESFRAYAEAMPNNCILLVDTYDTIAGVHKAVEIGRALRAQGHDLVGVRLDSGDLTALSIEARRILDEAGFPDAAIVASNDLDEHRIDALKREGATIAVWGVGTRLTTAYDQPALGGVYKLAAVREGSGPWQHRIKLSEQPIKVSNPGRQQIRRYSAAGRPIADAIYDLESGVAAPPMLIDPLDPSHRTTVPDDATHDDLLVPVFRDGDRIREPESAAAARARAQRGLASLPEGVERRVDPAAYPVGLERRLAELKESLMAAANGVVP